MPITLTWTGHSTWLIDTSAGRIVVDPFFDDCPTASMKAADVECRAILITHAHFDHIADAAAIAKQNRAQVVCNFEISQWLGKQGVGNVQPCNHGGRVAIPGGTSKMEIAFHSSGLPDGSYGGNPAGFLLDIDGVRLYVAGDTSLFSDMERIGRGGLDAAILPIGDVFTMGPEDAVEATRLLAPEVVLPCHYGTWPPIEQDPQAWAEMIRQGTSAEPRVLAVGESTSIG